MADETSDASAWVRRFAGLVAPGGRVLDLACGGGRHLRLFRAAGHPVLGIDRDLSGVRDLEGRAGVELRERDLEDGLHPGLEEAAFAGVVVTHYLHRPLFPALLAALAPGGVLIYETFAQGNERFGRPRNPDFLLAPGELLALSPPSHVVAYEHGEIERPDGTRAVVQRVCVVKRVCGPTILLSNSRGAARQE